MNELHEQMNHFIFAIGSCFFTITFLFILAWIWHVKFNNKYISDIIWSLSFPVQALIYSINCEGDLIRKSILFVMIMAWGAQSIIRIISKNRQTEKSGSFRHISPILNVNTPIKVLFVFLTQALLSTFFAFPFYIICQNINPSLSNTEYIGVFFFIIALYGQIIAHKQLDEFRKNPLNKSRVLNEGLWYYSRNPACFFIWMTWISIFFIALGSEYGFAAILSPTIMLHFVLNIPGIIATTDSSMHINGHAYEEYEQSTSRLIPWFKKRVNRF